MHLAVRLSRTRHGDGESAGEPMSAQTSDFVIPGLVVCYANDRGLHGSRMHGAPLELLGYLDVIPPSKREASYNPQSRN